MYELLGRILIEANLCASLLEDPLQAAAGLGVSLTEEQVAGLRASDLAAATEGLDERLSKARSAGGGWWPL